MHLLPDLVEYDETEGCCLEQDPTGLLNEGFRYRDLSTGTFLSRDPLGFKAGPNMYTYVRQNPWTHFDPEGLEPEQIPEDIYHVAKAGVKAGEFVGKQIVKGGEWEVAHAPGQAAAAARGAGVVANFVKQEAAAAERGAGVVGDALKSATTTVDKSASKVANAKPAQPNTPAQPAVKQPPNPYGSKGNPEHQAATAQLIDEMQAKHPDATITSNQSIKQQTGINRRPDAAATQDGKVVGVGEVARTNQSGTLVSREQAKQDQYKTAGIPSTVKTLPPKPQPPPKP